MTGEWTKKNIDEIKADFSGAIAIGPFGSRMKSDCYVETGIPVIRGTNITGGRSFVGDFVFISDEKAKSLGSSNVYKNDLVFPHRGAIGEVGIILKDEHYVLSSSLMKVTCNTSKAYPLFLYYFFKSHQGRYELLKNASQVGTPGIGQPLTSLKSIKVPLPPIPEQKAIAHILGTLDDKIELNRKMNETLEAMAQALFKSWFVDFDPVIDNALLAGKPLPDDLEDKAAARQEQLEATYGSLDAAAASHFASQPSDFHHLFPDSLEQTEELGWIPEGWKVGKLSDVARNPRQGVKPSDIDPGTPYIGLQDMPQKSISLSSWGNSDDVESNKYKFSRGDILFGKLRPYFHKVGIAPVDGVCSTDILVVLPKVPSLFAVALGHITSVEFIEFVTSASTGTRMPRTNWKDMGRYEIVIPPESIAQVMTSQFKDIVAKLMINIEQSNELAHTRDTLLPKLLSGEVRVPEAEEMMEDA